MFWLIELKVFAMRMFSPLPAIALSLFCLGLVSCELALPDAPAENEVLDGPMEGLTANQVQLFLLGDEAFGEVFTPETGLGPLFVANSCAACHVGDGKGHPATMLTRFGRWEGGAFDPLVHLGGPQLQHRAIPGFQPEVLPAQATVFTGLIAPAVTGLGLLEAVPDATLLALADPEDADGDGISGRAAYVFPPDFFEPQPHHVPDSAGRYIGRFGKKAAAIDLLHQTVNAYKQDIGVTSDFDLEDPFNPQVSNQPVDAVDDPEISAATVQQVVFYLRTLKAPLPRNGDDPAVIRGRELFLDIGCGACHTPTLRTGPSPIAPLSEVEFHPYTDLLLHDMGPELDDGYTEGGALPSEWRTPPLWGLGLSPDAQGGQYFLLHDGRARSIEEAILFHGGEGTASREAFQNLSHDDKKRLLAFLESL